ncbi:unnamed protein product [Phaeothamnion confervicola]
MTSIKMTYQGETRRFVLPSASPTVVELHAEVRRLYGGIGDAPLRVSYTDDEGDVVTIRGDDELRLVLGSGSVRFDVTAEGSSTTTTAPLPPAGAMSMDQPQRPSDSTKEEQQQATPAPEPEPGPNLHVSVQCDGCGVSPIVGPRYKCAVRDDYDLCEQCEAAGEHPYPFIKIARRAQAPLAILCVLKEDEPATAEDIATQATHDWSRVASFAYRHCMGRAGTFGGFGPGFGTGRSFGGPGFGSFGGPGFGGCHGFGGGCRYGRGGGRGCGSRVGGCCPGHVAASGGCGGPQRGAGETKESSVAASEAEAAAIFQSHVEKWREQLVELEQMGFTDVARNIELLERYGRTFGVGHGGGNGGDNGGDSSRGLALVIQDLMNGMAGLYVA